MSIDSSIRAVVHNPFLLAIRLLYGLQLCAIGYSKLAALSGTAGYFSSLGLPFPEVSALLCGIVECLGGLCLALGAFSSETSLLVVSNMCVAVFMGHRSALLGLLSNPEAVTKLSAVGYLVVATIVFLVGPGTLSVDFMFRRKEFDAKKFN